MNDFPLKMCPMKLDQITSGKAYTIMDLKGQNILSDELLEIELRKFYFWKHYKNHASKIIINVNLFPSISSITGDFLNYLWWFGTNLIRN